MVRTSCGTFAAHGAMSLVLCIACAIGTIASVIHMKIKSMVLRIISFPRA